MYWHTFLAAALSACGLSLASVVTDDETGFSFSEYAVPDQHLTFRLAIPKPATEGYDVVFQLIAPSATGWAGLSWGGSMLECPLTVGWAFENSPVLHVRRTSGHVQPKPYTGATVQLLAKGNKVNDTHWQVTALCSGCSSFNGTDGDSAQTDLDPNGSNRLAFAYSEVRPSTASSDATLEIHDDHGSWLHDFSVAGNENFDQLVQESM